MFKIEHLDPQILVQINRYSLFDFYRIVDVETYAVYDWQDGKIIDTHQRCYEIWKRADACKNCISHSCILEERHIIKLEYFEDEIFFIMALPILLENRRFSLELISNVTHSLVINDNFHVQNFSAHKIITQMNEMAVHDPYTGIYNKRYAEQELCKAVLNWKKDSTLFIAVLDIDHFKQINDTYGHVEGDKVLHALARILEEYAAQADGWASRIGGDEFMVLLSGLTPQAAHSMTQKMQEKVASLVFTKKDQLFRFAISVGLAEYRPELADWKAFVDEADQEMYRKKREKYGPRTE